MAVAFVAAEPFSQGAGAFCEGTVTVAAGQGLLVLAAVNRLTNGVNHGVTLAKWDNGGPNETNLIKWTGSEIGQQGAELEVWYLPFPTPKTATIRLEWSTVPGNPTHQHFDAVRFTGHDAASFATTPGTDNGSGRLALTSQVLSAEGGLSVDIIAITGGVVNLAVNAGQTERTQVAPTSHIWATSTKPGETGGGNHNLGWTWETNTRNACQVAVHIIEAVAGPGTPVLGAVEAADDVSARMPLTPGSGADTHDLHKSTTLGFTPAPGNLDSSYGGSVTEVITQGALTADTDWYFKVVASNAGGTSTSNEVTTKTAPAAPTAMLVNGPTSSSLDVTPSGGGVATSTVEVYRRQGAGTWALVLSAAPGFTWPFTDTGLDPATIYDYQARCLGNGWASRFSPIGQGQTSAVAATMMMLRRRRAC